MQYGKDLLAPQLDYEMLEMHQTYNINAEQTVWMDPPVMWILWGHAIWDIFPAIELSMIQNSTPVKKWTHNTTVR